MAVPIPDADKQQIITNVKTLLGITDTSKDALLDLLLNKTYSDWLDYTLWDEKDEDTGEYIIPNGIYSSWEDYMIYKYRKMGLEGYDSFSEGSLSITPAREIPSDIKRVWNKYKRMRFH